MHAYCTKRAYCARSMSVSGRFCTYPHLYEAGSPCSSSRAISGPIWHLTRADSLVWSIQGRRLTLSGSRPPAPRRSLAVDPGKQVSCIAVSIQSLRFVTPTRASASATELATLFRCSIPASLYTPLGYADGGRVEVALELTRAGHGRAVALVISRTPLAASSPSRTSAIALVRRRANG